MDPYPHDIATRISGTFETLIDQTSHLLTAIQKHGAEKFSSGDYADTERLLAQVRRLSDIRGQIHRLQDEWLRELPALSTDANTSAHDKPFDVDGSVNLIMSHKDACAIGRYKAERVTMLAGSTICRSAGESLPGSLAQRRRECENDGSLVEESANLWHTTRNLAFDSPSAAASFVGGCSLNGLAKWKLRDTRVSLRRYLRSKGRISVPSGTGTITASFPSVTDLAAHHPADQSNGQLLG